MIYTECKPDSALVKTLGIPKKEIIHLGGKPEVCNNDLIVLCPRLEEWLLKATKDAQIDIKRYNLPDDSEHLHKEINLNIDKVEKLIKDLKVKSKMMKALKKSIKERMQK